MTDYTLFPIPKADVDWVLYHLVAHFMKCRYNLDRITDGDGMRELFKPLDDDAEQEDRKFVYYLVFPDEEQTLSYPPEMLEHEVVIMKSFFDIEHAIDPNPILGDDDPDADVWYEKVPLEYFHYAGEGESLSLKLERDKDLPKGFPNIVWNGDAFAAAIGDLLGFLQKHGLGASSWSERLQMVLRMLEGEANELHILHNAGLYDHRVLWKWLGDKGVPQAGLDDVKHRYVSELKRYAMFVFNRLDWHWDSICCKDGKEKQAEPFRALPEEKAEPMSAKKRHKKTQRIILIVTVVLTIVYLTYCLWIIL